MCLYIFVYFHYVHIGMSMIMNANEEMHAGNVDTDASYPDTDPDAT